MMGFFHAQNIPYFQKIAFEHKKRNVSRYEQVTFHFHVIQLFAFRAISAKYFFRFSLAFGVRFRKGRTEFGVVVNQCDIGFQAAAAGNFQYSLQ